MEILNLTLTCNQSWFFFLIDFILLTALFTENSGFPKLCILCNQTGSVPSSPNNVCHTPFTTDQDS